MGKVETGHGNRKAKFAKSLTNHLLSSLKGGDAETFSEIFITLASTKSLFYIAVANVLSLLWQLKVSIDL